MTSHVHHVRALYKVILRLHRGLPLEMQVLGDNYVKSEFKRHKKCTNEEAVVFMHQWTDYAVTIAQQLGLKGPQTAKGGLGRQLDMNQLEWFSDEQVVQLHELMKAAKNDKDGKDNSKLS